MYELDVYIIFFIKTKPIIMFFIINLLSGCLLKYQYAVNNIN